MEEPFRNKQGFADFKCVGLREVRVILFLFTVYTRQIIFIIFLPKNKSEWRGMYFVSLYVGY